VTLVYPFTFVDGTIADGVQVNANFKYIAEQVEGVSAAAVGTDVYQAGAVASTDWVPGAGSIVAGTGVLSFTTFGGAAWLPGPVSGLVRTFTTAGTVGGLKPPVLPGPAGYLNVGVELTASGAAATVSVVSGAEQVSEALALSNPPAVSAGKMRVRNVVILNTAGSYSIAKEIDQRPWSTGGGTAPVFNPGTQPVGALTRGHASIATEQERENVAFGLLATPDEVSVTLPENGLIFLLYQAQWKSSVAAAGRACIFLEGNEVQGLVGATKPGGVATTSGTVFNTLLSQGSAGSGGAGLRTEAVAGAYVATGELASDFTVIRAAAGTYKVSVRYRATSGSVGVKERKLQVEARAF
jgi:hypothetical protein